MRLPISTGAGAPTTTAADGGTVTPVVVKDAPAQAHTVTLETSLARSAGEGAGILGEFTDVTPYNVMMLFVETVVTSIDVTVSLDGTNYTDKITLIDVETDAPYATASIDVTGVYKLKGKYKSVIITAFGAGASSAYVIFGVE